MSEFWMSLFVNFVPLLIIGAAAIFLSRGASKATGRQEARQEARVQECIELYKKMVALLEDIKQQLKDEQK